MVKNVFLKYYRLYILPSHTNDLMMNWIQVPADLVSKNIRFLLRFSLALSVERLRRLYRFTISEHEAIVSSASSFVRLVCRLATEAYC